MAKSIIWQNHLYLKTTEEIVRRILQEIFWIMYLPFVRIITIIIISSSSSSICNLYVFTAVINSDFYFGLSYSNSPKCTSILFRILCLVTLVSKWLRFSARISRFEIYSQGVSDYYRVFSLDCTGVLYWISDNNKVFSIILLSPPHSTAFSKVAKWMVSINFRLFCSSRYFLFGSLGQF